MPGNTIRMVPPEGGEAVDVPVDQVQTFRELQYTEQSNAARATELVNSARDDYYSRPDQKARAVLEAGGRAVSGGLTDVAGRALGGDDTRRDMDARREHNPGLTTAVEVGAGLLPIGLGGLASRAGAKIAGTGGGALKQIARSGVSGVVEGGIQGVGSGVSEVALSDKPLDLEHIASTLKSNFFYGGMAGGVAGVAAKGLERGLTRAKAALDDVAARPLGTLGDDTAKLSAVDDLATYQKTVKDANPWAAISEGEEASLLNGSRNQLRKAMNDPKGLAKSPGSLLKPLRVQEQAFERALAKSDEIAERLAAGNQKIAKGIGEQMAALPGDATEVVLTGKAAQRYGTFADVKVGKVDKVPTVSVSRDDAGTFLKALDAGEVAASGQKSLGKLEILLEANRGLQAKIEAATAKPVAASASVTGALGDAATGYALGDLSGIPGLGVLAAGARFAGPLIKKLGASKVEMAGRASKAVGAFLDVTRKVSPAAPVLASKVLSSVRYGEQQEERRKSKMEQAPAKAPSLARSFKARSAEIRAAVEPALDGSGTVRTRPEVRERIAQQLAPLAAASPVLADRLETIAARRVEFLASKLPRRPDAFGAPVGPDRWQPSDMEMRTFARYVSAVEDPGAVVERLADGSVTPEDAEAMRTVYPEMFHDIQQQILEQLPTLRATLPYQRRLAFSVFSGVPVDPALDPAVLSRLQASFATEQGTQGGTQAPRAEPAFGSISRETSTPAQQRGA
jgi:hypothetical protein